MSVNKNTADIEHIQENVEEIQEDVDEIQEDVDEIQKDVDEIQEGIEDLGDEEDVILPKTEQEVTLLDIKDTLSRLQSELERLKK